MTALERLFAFFSHLRTIWQVILRVVNSGSRGEGLQCSSILARIAILFASSSAIAFVAGCASFNVGTTDVLTVQASISNAGSANSSSGSISITVAPTDQNGEGEGTTGFTLSFRQGTQVTLTAPQQSAGATFSSWNGCTSSNGAVCTIMVGANATVVANYQQPRTPAVTPVTVSPGPAINATIGSTVQFTATVQGAGSDSNQVQWSVQGPTNSSLSPGDIDSTGLYTTPYPAPATVTVIATNTQDPTKVGSTTVTLLQPPASAGPALTVNVADETHPINPDIYGMNSFALDMSAASAANVPLIRWGGDTTTRYNYQMDVTSAANGWYFENRTGTTADGQNAVTGTSAFNALVANASAIGAKTMGTVPVLGWVAKDNSSCGFPSFDYPNQSSFDPNYSVCGSGQMQSGSDIVGNSPAITSMQVGPAWVNQWVSSLVNTFGNAASGGISIYELDNEPSWWDTLHRDVHPLPFTYDEVTKKGLATAEAVKQADPTAEISGPVLDYWWSYFYSKKDIEAGLASGTCNGAAPWSNPVDRNAHGGVPFIEYYLQQFQAAETRTGKRMLDYLDLHTYFAATYNGASVGFGITPAGDTGAQQARLNSTRAFWDPTYVDPDYAQPNYSTDSNFVSTCSPPAQSPQLIPMMQQWVARDYPGTKTAISEYNWGGQEHINGAIAQADILGIFGSYGLDLATLWGPPDPQKQVPGLMAFKMFRNYDGAGSQFGNIALASNSADQSKLAVYGAVRTSDGTITVIVLNKTYGDLSTSLVLQGIGAGGSVSRFEYSNANLAAIVPKSQTALPPAPEGSKTTSMTATFPAQSITLFAISPQ